MDFIELSRSRYSCRKFSDKAVEQDKIDRILETVRDAPTAMDLQPFHVWVIRNRGRLEDLKDCTPYTFGAPVVLMFGYNEKSAYTRKFDGKNFADIDATIAATHAMLAIHAVGLESTWVGHFDPAKVEEHFPETKGYSVTALFPFGYPAEDGVPSERHSARKSIEELVTEL